MEYLLEKPSPVSHDRYMYCLLFSPWWARWARKESENISYYPLPKTTYYVDWFRLWNTYVCIDYSIDIGDNILTSLLKLLCFIQNILQSTLLQANKTTKYCKHSILTLYVNFIWKTLYNWSKIWCVTFGIETPTVIEAQNHALFRSLFSNVMKTNNYAHNNSWKCVILKQINKI